MDQLSKDIEAYDAWKVEHGQQHALKWVVFYQCQYEGAYDTFDDAAQYAIETHGRGPYLIRQVGAPPPRLSSVVQFGIPHVAG